MKSQRRGGKQVRLSASDVPETWRGARELIELVYSDGSKATRYKALQAIRLMAAAAPEGPFAFGLGSLVNLKAIYKAQDGGREPESLNSVLRAVRAVCGILVFESRMERNPFDMKRDWFAREKDPLSQEGKHLTVEQLLRVFDRADVEATDPLAPERGPRSLWRARRRRALLYLAVYTGVRAQEALRSRREDLDLTASTLRITDTAEGDTKTEHSRDWVPIPAAAAEVLRDWSESLNGECLFPQVRLDKPWKGGSRGYKPLDEIKDLGWRAGVPGVTILALRHTFSTHAEQLWGLTREQIKRIMRHTTIDTQKSYQHRDVDNLVRLVQRQDFRVFADGA